MRLGGNFQSYSLQCLVTHSRVDNMGYMFTLNTLTSLSRAVSVWILVVLIAAGVNAITVCVVFILSFFDAYRQSVVNR